MKLGISGSRSGLSNKARETFIKFLQEHDISEVHHGDCVGVD